MPLTGEEDILDTSQAAAEDDSRHPDASVKHVKAVLFSASATLPSTDLETVTGNQLEISKEVEISPKKRKSSAIEISESRPRSFSRQSKAVNAKDFATMKEKRDIATYKNANPIQDLARTQELQALKEASSSISKEAKLRKLVATQGSQLALLDQLRSFLPSTLQKWLEFLKHEWEYNVRHVALIDSINELNDKLELTDKLEDLDREAIKKCIHEMKQRNEDFLE